MSTKSSLPKLSDPEFDLLCHASDNATRKLTSLDFAERLFGDEALRPATAAKRRKSAGKVADRLARMGFLEHGQGFFRITDAGREYLATPVPPGVEV